MDDGLVAECGSPAEVLNKPDSKFSEFVESLGGNGAEQFKEMLQASQKL